MNLSRLARQLRREAMANPKKAAVLGLLVLVALYYWGPLVWGWVAADEAAGPPPDAPAAGVASPGAANLATTEPTPQDGQTVTYPWTQLDEWIRQDPMTAPAEDVARWRDPFAFASTGPKAAEVEPAQGEPSRLSPEGLGIELAGTLVGPRRRVALIGGKAYREGQTVKIDRNGQSLEFQLAEVHSQRIVLEREGRRFDLLIPKRNAAGGIGPAGQ